MISLRQRAEAGRHANREQGYQPEIDGDWRPRRRLTRPATRWPRLAMLPLLLLLFASLRVSAEDTEALRPEAVGWARLKTPGEFWMRHAERDPTLMQFLRENTTLNIDPTWYVADVDNLSQMCAYPLLFSQGIHMLNTPTARANLAEYMRRGGFLLIDSCINKGVTPDPDEFLRRQIAMLEEILPEASIEPLPSNHDVYSCFFHIPDGRPPHTFFEDVYDADWDKFGLYGVMIGHRMAGIISLSGLQCGWAGMIAPAGHDVDCMKMVVNIYIWAMMQGGENGPTTAAQ
jgi:hypothetical protein